MTTPDTVFYFYLGYSIILGAMALYIVSLFLRWRRLKQEEKQLSKPKI